VSARRTSRSLAATSWVETRRVPANWSVVALHAAGAESVAEARENGVLVGYDIRPAVSDEDYEVAAATASLPPVPSSISDRQFAQQLAILGMITEGEALAWAARGDLPPALDTAIEALPGIERFAARMLLSAATSYERAHPLVAQLGEVMGYDAAGLDDLWRKAAEL
jgi:hypothetical protein